MCTFWNYTTFFRRNIFFPAGTINLASQVYPLDIPRLGNHCKLLFLSLKYIYPPNIFLAEIYLSRASSWSRVSVTPAPAPAGLWLTRILRYLQLLSSPGSPPGLSLVRCHQLSPLIGRERRVRMCYTSHRLRRPHRRHATFTENFSSISDKTKSLHKKSKSCRRNLDMLWILKSKSWRT